MPIRHRITIRADERRGFYSAAGAASISSSVNPMLDCARSLLAHGAEPSSTLEGRYEGALVGPTSLASIVRPRKILRTDHRAGEVSRNVD
jgi:hypothetical protein